MKPQVFISSTFYDLKYVREELSNFVKGYGFEPILFESGDVGYHIGEALDESCFYAVRNADIIVLIIGGRYGSPRSGQRYDDTKEYESVTRGEFNSANEANVPIVAFVDKAVYSEYKIYLKNKKEIENKEIEIKFYAADNLNIFRFIESIDILPYIPLIEFEHVKEIKDFLSKQWADLFKRCLHQQRYEDEIKNLITTVNQIQCNVNSIKIFADEISKGIVEDSSVADRIIKKQDVEYVANKIANTFEFIASIQDREELKAFLHWFVEKVFEAKLDGILDYVFSPNKEDLESFYNFFGNEYSVFITKVKEHLQLDEKFMGQGDIFVSSVVERILKDNEYLRKMKLLN